MFPYGSYTWTDRTWNKNGPVGYNYVGLVVDSTLPNGTTVIDTLYNYNPGDSLWVIHNRKVTGEKHDSLEQMLCNEPMNQYPTAPTISFDTNTCYTYLMMDAQYNAQTNYGNYIDSVENAFRTQYITHCMNVDDSFHLKMPYDMYHFTLYYYDQAGNLVKTIPPQGVHPITSQTLLNNITNYRAGTYGTPTYPTDSLMTRYFYNTLNSPIKQQTPDGDSVHFWYDRLGRICLSQNAIQRPAYYFYSYTKYDALNRINEVGQVSTVPQNLPACFVCNHCIIKYEVQPVVPDTFTRNQLELENFINLGTRTQIVHTYYDSVMFKYIPMQQQNLRKRIASITYKENNNNPNGERTNPDSIYSRPDSAAKDYDNAIHYSYDIEGNVSSILIDVPHDSIVHQRYKRINYYYDLISGNVDEIIYEPDSIDQFIHVYQYDADDRITDVMTSRDSLYWENDVSYEYYDHGPLAREVIGQRQVQGIDYAYTINGWIKAVNSSLGSYKVRTWPPTDMGEDGYVHGANVTIGRDAFGYDLNYFNGDYRPIDRNHAVATGLPATDLYNGNIGGATYAIRTLSPAVIGYTYGYDQLNRMVSELAFKGIDTTTVLNNWVATDSIKDFREKVSYDENGNILTYLRHGNTNIGPLAMDSLNYRYNLNTNQLREVNDAVTATNYTVDIDNETSKHNYRYNGIGELASDSIAGIDSIYWTVYNKVKKIVKTNNDSIVYMYDPLGNRIEERNFPHSGTSDTIKYTRDVKGNIMAIYDRKKDTVRLSEFDMYGGKRLGSFDTVLRMQKFITGHGTLDSLTISYLERQKQYELDNHLGNVLVTVSDGKTPFDTNAATPGVADYYIPIIINAQDYYPFGMMEPGRSYTLSGDSTYKYLFNGKLHDDNIYGKDNSYDYGARFYDPRLGRFLSTDPLGKKAPNISPYVFVEDKPIIAKDPDGKLVIFINGMYDDGSGGKSSYWGGYDKKTMNQLQDHNARYVDGALGGKANTTAWAKTGYMVGGVIGAAYAVANYSNVNMQVRINAGEAQGMKDAPSIIASLKPGETIKIITHSMGTAYARGYVQGILQYAKEHPDVGNKVKIEYEMDVNSFQGKSIPPPSNTIATKKSKNAGNQGLIGAKCDNPPGTTPQNKGEENKTHSIETMGITNYKGNPATGDLSTGTPQKNPPPAVQEGNNNVNSH